ncbi:hypothetical protein Tco_0206689 [Tanacetum coccineum]
MGFNFLLGQKNILAKYMILSDADNRPPMLDKDLYDSWKSRMELYMQNREHGRMILESVENGLLIWPTVEENGVTKIKKYAELSAAEKIQADCDMKATNIILQGLPTDIYSIERECKLYDAFDKFTHIKGESLHKYYLRFTQVINDMNIYNMKMEQFQVNTKFLNSLPPEWIRLLRKSNQDPLAFVANQQMTPPHFNSYQSSYNNPQLQQQVSPSQYGSIHPAQHYLSTYPSQPQFSHSSVPPSYPYQSQMNHQTSSVPQIAYQSPQVSTQSITESPLMDSGFAVPVFFLGDDPIACLNKAMAFLMVVASLSFEETMQEARHRSCLCYNCQGEDIMARQCTRPKQPRNAAWYKDKAMLVEAQEVGQILNEEQLVFLTDPGVLDGQAVQTIIPNNADFQTEDLDTYDSNCDDISNAKAVLMTNISNYGSNVISEFYLRKAQRIKPTLYDGIVISDKHVAMHVIDDEETLILEEKIQSKMSEKGKDPEVIKKNISHKPIDYEKLNSLSEDFGKHFTPQQEMNAKQAFWFRISNPTIESSNPPPVKAEVPSELPNVSLVNASLKKLKFHLTQFDSMVKKRTTPDARTEGKIKGKEIIDIAAQIPSANTIVLGMFKLDLEPLAPRLLQNREAHIDYLKYTQEQANILRGIVEQVKAEQPLDKELDFAWKHAQRIQELLVYVRDTCPNVINLSAKKVAVTPKNKVKKVRIEVLKDHYSLCSSKKAKIVESKNANHSEPNHTWGSNATDIPSSSSFVMTACALGKSKKYSHQPKAEDTNQEKLYLLHMDLCGPMDATLRNALLKKMSYSNLLAEIGQRELGSSDVIQQTNKKIDQIKERLRWSRQANSHMQKLREDADR